MIGRSRKVGQEDYKYKQVKVPNLVYFWSPSIALFNSNRTISINDQILLILFNWEVTAIFALNIYCMGVLW